MIKEKPIAQNKDQENPPEVWDQNAQVLNVMGGKHTIVMSLLWGSHWHSRGQWWARSKKQEPE